MTLLHCSMAPYYSIMVALLVVSPMITFLVLNAVRKLRDIDVLAEEVIEVVIAEEAVKYKKYRKKYRKKYTCAYLPWKPLDDELLLTNYETCYSTYSNFVATMSDSMGRTHGAIRSRLQKLTKEKKPHINYNKRISECQNLDVNV